MAPLPDPPIPVDLDCRDADWFCLYHRRLRDSELASIPDAEIFRTAVLSWCVAFDQVPAGSLPDDDASLARLLGWGRDLKGWKKHREAGGLRGWILCSDGRLYHPEVAERAAEAMGFLSKKKRVRNGTALRVREWRAKQKRDGNASHNGDSNEDVTRYETGNVTPMLRSHITGHNRTVQDREEPPLPPKGERAVQASIPGAPKRVEGGDVDRVIEVYNIARRAMREWQGKKPQVVAPTPKRRETVAAMVKHHQLETVLAGCFGIFCDPFRRGEVGTESFKGECFELGHLAKNVEKFAELFPLSEAQLYADRLPETLERFTRALDDSRQSTVRKGGRALHVVASMADERARKESGERARAEMLASFEKRGKTVKEAAAEYGIVIEE